MSKKQKLELTWIGKNERPKLEPRILIEDPSLSYCGREQKPGDNFDNVLIKGDNLLALKAMEQDFKGRVKCACIDPPYNTGSAFAHYEDGVEHSIWLSLLRERLELIRLLLAEDGSIWITIDDNESHYLKVMCDEIFGRTNFVANIIWQKIYTLKNSARHFSGMHDHILVYARNVEKWQRNLLPRSEELNESYSNPDSDRRGPWTTNAVQARNYYSQGSYEISSPAGEVFRPPSGTYWRISKETFLELDADKRVWWGRDGKAVPRIKKFLSEAKQGVVPSTLWMHTEVGNNAEAKEEVRALSLEDDTDIFSTPKPERLIRQILEISTKPGDLVLDSFAGSGTTGAVAHKMGRKWIMVELGDHAETHILPRLRKVIDGNAPGGVTEAVGWKGGGGFRYYTLAPSLLEKDKYDNWIISKKYDANMLAAAVCKLMGFIYEPSRDEREYWRHGYSTETDFIYVTTQSLTYDALKRLSEDVGRKRTLLVCCKAFNAKEDAFDNITLRKIPQVVLKKCEWGRDDYSLKIAKVALTEVPVVATPPEPEEDTAPAATPKKRTRKSRKKPDVDGTPDMFAKRVEA